MHLLSRAPPEKGTCHRARAASPILATSRRSCASLRVMEAGKLRAVGGDAESAMGAAVSESSARLERGELTIDEYLDVLVSNSVAQVQGKLSTDRIAWLRGMLRDQLTSDPVLRERVRQATGREPQAR